MYSVPCQNLSFKFTISPLCLHAFTIKHSIVIEGFLEMRKRKITVNTFLSFSNECLRFFFIFFYISLTVHIIPIYWYSSKGLVIEIPENTTCFIKCQKATRSWMRTVYEKNHKSYKNMLENILLWMEYINNDILKYFTISKRALCE